MEMKQEIMDDTMDDVQDVDDEEETDRIVDQVLDEIGISMKEQVLFFDRWSRCRVEKLVVAKLKRMIYSRDWTV